MTTRPGWVRSAALATAIALTSFASTAHAQATPEPSPASAPASAPASPEASPEASPAPSPGATGATGATGAITTNEPPPANPTNRTAWPWIIMGTGIALVATAAVLQIRSVSEDDKRESDEVKLLGLPQGDPQRKELQASASDHDESSANSRTAAMVVGTVGFLAIAGSVVWWFFEGGSSTPSPPASAKLKPTFTPSVAPGYGGLSFGSAF